MIGVVWNGLTWTAEGDERSPLGSCHYSLQEIHTLSVLTVTGIFAYQRLPSKGRTQKSSFEEQIMRQIMMLDIGGTLKSSNSSYGVSNSIGKSPRRRKKGQNFFPGTTIFRKQTPILNDDDKELDSIMCLILALDYKYSRDFSEALDVLKDNGTTPLSDYFISYINKLSQFTDDFAIELMKKKNTPRKQNYTTDDISNNLLERTKEDIECEMRVILKERLESSVGKELWDAYCDECDDYDYDDDYGVDYDDDFSLNECRYCRESMCICRWEGLGRYAEDYERSDDEYDRYGDEDDYDFPYGCSDYEDESYRYGY